MSSFVVQGLRCKLCHSHAVAVEGVKVTSLTDTSVNVSWNAMIIPDFPIDNYTVVYSPVSESDRRQDGEMTSLFQALSHLVSLLTWSQQSSTSSKCLLMSQSMVCHWRESGVYLLLKAVGIMHFHLLSCTSGIYYVDCLSLYMYV